MAQHQQITQQNQGQIPQKLVDEETEGKIQQLTAEANSLGESYPLALRLMQIEIEKLQRGEKEKPKYVDVVAEKTVKLTEKIYIPYREHPRVNYVGKLLGPKGLSLKRLQDDTGCKMAILGRGSMRDKKQEEELRKEGGPKYSHLNEDLHVCIDVIATVAEAHQRLSHGMSELKKFFTPEFSDEIRAQQYEAMIAVDPENAPRPGDPGHPGPRGGAGGRGGRGMMGGPRGRGGRGGVGPGGPRGGMGGGRGAPRGGMGGRGGGYRGDRGGGPSPPNRGGFGRGMNRQDTIESYDEGYVHGAHTVASTPPSRGGSAAGRTVYREEGSYSTVHQGGTSTAGMAAANQESFAADEQYEPYAQEGTVDDSQAFFDYGHGSDGSGSTRGPPQQQSYDDSYGNGDSWGTGGRNTMKAPPARSPAPRAHPYSGVGRGGY